jgi:SAM-dependent methyltransferase
MSNDSHQTAAKTWWTPARQKKFLGGRNLLVTPWQEPELLGQLSLINRDGSMSADASRKFIQINHMLQLLLPPLKQLAKQAPVLHVTDAGCGNGYLTFLTCWYMKSILRHPTLVMGVDSEPDRLARARQRAVALNFADELRFHEADLRTFRWPEAMDACFGPSDRPRRPHAFFALHACDIATDYALAEALRLKTDVIAVAPCCQAELARLWKESAPASGGALEPIFRHAHFRREIGADMTDVLRTLFLRSRGYEVTVTEFVASEHTPKNRLLLAIRRGSFLESAWAEYQALQQSLGGVRISLENLLPSWDDYRASLT